MVVEAPNPTGVVQMRPLGLWGPTMPQVGVYAGPVTIPPTINPVPPRTPDGTRYTVKTGDTLTTIAWKYPDVDIIATSLATINHIYTGGVVLRAGLVIFIRRPVWKVAAGQTLEQIANFYPEQYITANSIAILNKLSGPSVVLTAGQLLTVG
jgi:LysM repeat protein